MKMLAMLDLAPGLPVETVRVQLDSEIKGSWALYASGVLREVYATPAQPASYSCSSVRVRPQQSNIFVSSPWLRQGSSDSSSSKCRRSSVGRDCLPSEALRQQATCG